MSDLTEDVVVYADPDGVHYVANFTEQGWIRWPAEHDGWQRRKPCGAELAERCEELPRVLAELALLLSGVTADGE